MHHCPGSRICPRLVVSEIDLHAILKRVHTRRFPPSSCRVTLGWQTSAPSNGTSSYAPPSISEYDGPGAAAADTIGSQVHGGRFSEYVAAFKCRGSFVFLQAVVISGHNFGPLGTIPDSATYGGPNATEFYASGCSEHSEETCERTVSLFSAPVHHLLPSCCMCLGYV